MAGFFDALTNLNPDQNAGLLGFASTLLSNSSDPRRPTDFGAATQGGIQGAAQSRQRKLEEEQAQQLAAMRAQQMEAGAFELQSQRSAAAQQAAIQKAAQDAMQGGQFDANAFVNSVRAIDPIKAAQFEQQLAKSGPEFDTKPQTAIGADGKPFQYIVAKNGEIKRLDGVLPRDELKLANLGGRDVAYNPYALREGQAFDRTATPDAVLSANVSRENSMRADARAREANTINRDAARTQVINDPNAGLILVDKGTGQARAAIGADGQPIMGSEKLKTQVGAQKLLPVVQQAKELINGATGSYGGALTDQAARVFGSSTQGAQAIAKLQVLESQLILNQPRMEGPQSDRDTMLYRQAAGKIGDPTVPKAEKLAALNEIESITARNAGVQPAQANTASSSKKASLADIAETARKSGRSTAEVTKALRDRGYTIEGGR